jgi:CRISPR-associated endoribonuclease Cas6
MSKKDAEPLTYNYQYYLASALYATIGKKDVELASKLHKNMTDKFLTFSWIYPDKPVFKGGINFKEAFFIFSTPDESLACTLANGLLDNPFLHINNTPVEVNQIEILPEPRLSESARLKTLSPIYIKRTIDGKERDLYPEDPKWKIELANNLINKYEVFNPNNKKPIPSITQINKVKKKRVRIADSYRRCNMLEFTVIGDPELVLFGYQAGFGEKNTMGFGCTEVIH